MNLCLIRHADAEALPEGSALGDADRPLTEKGWRQCEALARALARFGLQPGPILTSPLLRARQTAEGLLRHWPAPQPEVRECRHLAPGEKRSKLERHLTGLEGETATLIGHQPDLGRFLGWLLGDKRLRLTFPKAGAAFVECETAPLKGGGSLAWLITPAWCRVLGQAG